MARKIIKKIGGDRLGSGGKMTVAAHGYGYSTHDVSKIRRTSISFGTLVPMGQWLMPSKSRLTMQLDALTTSNALLYQLYGSAKFQIDVFSARMALYNPKMLLNLNDQGYEISDIKFPQMELKTRGYEDEEDFANRQVNPSALLRYLGIAANGQNITNAANEVTRQHNAMWLLMYYQLVKEYYANKQEKVGYVIHSGVGPSTVTSVVLKTTVPVTSLPLTQGGGSDGIGVQETSYLWINYDPSGPKPSILDIQIYVGSTNIPVNQMWNTIVDDGTKYILTDLDMLFNGSVANGWSYVSAPGSGMRLVEYDLKAIDRMTMAIMAGVEEIAPLVINSNSELPYSASFRKDVGNEYTVQNSQEGLCVGTYQSDVFNNWLDNATINNLQNRSKVKVDSNGEFSINDLNITQKLYNYDMRIGITDGTLEEWRELTYGEVGKSKSLKPVYVGGLSKEILFDMIVSTAGTEEEPLGAIASRGQFGSKHKGGYVQVEADEEMLVMVIAKITPRLVYNQGNDWTTNLKTLEDLHKPVFDKIGYQNLLTDQIVAGDTQVNVSGVLTTYSAGKQPAWQWYRTNYDDALGNMAGTENYKVFGREYEMEKVGTHYKIKDLTTYIDPTKFNDVFAISSLDAMNFDIQVGMETKLTMVMSEEVIPNL